MAEVRLMGLREYARHRGCTVGAVAKAIDEKRISVIVDEKGRKRIDPDVADIQWERNTRARADSGRAVAKKTEGEGRCSVEGSEAPAGPDSESAGPGRSDYRDTRALTELENLRRQRRENMLAEKKLAEVDKIRQTVFDSFRALRDRAFNVPREVAPRCIGLTDAREIERVVEEEQRKAFADWEAMMLEKLPKPDVEVDDAGY